MRLAMLAVPLMLSGCFCGPTPFPSFCSGPTPASGNPSLALAGSPVSLEFRFEGDCDLPTRLEVGVLDAQSRDVPATTSLDAYLGTVTFTPTTAGRHHVVARFQPNLGLVQTDVTVARDRSAEPGLTLPDLPAPIELSDGGLLVTELSAYRLGAGEPELLQSFLPRPVLRGEVVWGQTPLGLKRFVPGSRPDGGPQLVAAPVTALALRERFAPTEDDVLLHDSSSPAVELHSVGPDGGWLRRDFMLASPVVWSHRLGDQVISLTQSGSECVIELRDAGVPTCRQQMQAVFTRYLGGDLDGFWVSDSAGELLGYHGRGASMLELRLVSPGGGGASGAVLSVKGDSPVVQTGARELVPTARGGELSFEYWGPRVESASRRTVVTRTDAGTLLLRRR